MTSRHVEEELLAYLDGRLPPEEAARVAAHLADCPACAAELDRLRALQVELGTTFDAALSAVRLPAAADRRIREHLRRRVEPHGWRALWQRRGLIAQAAFGLLVILSLLATSLILTQPPQAGPQETVVLGQDQVAPGGRAALRVVVRDVETAQPVAGAQVVVRIGRTPGMASVVYTGRTGATGTADVAFTVPDDLDGEASLVVETTSPGGENRVVHPITVAREAKLFLYSDKPVYRPGQTVHVRTLALDATTLYPVVEDDITISLLDPAGREIGRAVATPSDFGVAWADFALPEESTLGGYTLRATLGNTVSERVLTVGDYDLPAFRVTLETDRRFYGPEDVVTGVVQAEYFFGQPVAGASVILRGTTGAPDRSLLILLEGRTGADGRYAFTFELPPAYGRLAVDTPLLFDLEVEVVDPAGRQEGIRRVLPVAAQPILIDVVAESGALKPGVENAIFIVTSYPDGQPAETMLTVHADGEEQTLATGPFGLAELRITPDGGALRLDIQALDAEGARGDGVFVLEGDDAPETLLLRAERAAYEAGETVRLEALLAGVAEGQPVYLDVVRERQMVLALSAPAEDGRAVFAFDLDGTLMGTLELHAYAFTPGGGLVEDRRRVLVDRPRQVAVAVTADQDVYRPGDTARVELRTEVDDEPAPAAVGIGVVDASVLALETHPPGFARTYFLLEEDLRAAQHPPAGLDIATLLDAEDAARAAQDRAARAAWAGVPGTPFSLAASAKTKTRPVPAGWAGIAMALAAVAAMLPLLLGVVVVRGLHATAVLKRALRRAALGLAIAFICAPLFAGALWLAWRAVGVLVTGTALVLLLALLVGLAVHSWRRRDQRIQIATGLLAGYLALGGLLVVLVAEGAGLPEAPIAIFVATFFLAGGALVVLGQGLVLEGWRRAGWVTTAMVPLLVAIVVTLPFVPGLASELTQSLGSPALYAGPAGWMTGCATDVVVETVEATVAGEGETETIVVTATPAATPLPQPVEPLPVRQVFPETLYWDPEAETGPDGGLVLDLPLADSVTTWQLTALASTEEGALGVGTYDLRAVQDLFVEIELPREIVAGEVVTATVVAHNTSLEVQNVEVELAPAEWYVLVDSAPGQSLDVPAGEVATATFALRPVGVGEFALRASARGAGIVDAIAVGVTVTP